MPGRGVQPGDRVERPVRGDGERVAGRRGADGVGRKGQDKGEGKAGAGHGWLRFGGDGCLFHLSYGGCDRSREMGRGWRAPWANRTITRRGRGGAECERPARWSPTRAEATMGS